MVLAKMDYSKLDAGSSPVRIRLNSTVVRARNEDAAAASGKQVTVMYVRDGQARSVRGSACVLACWNMMIPYLCPEMSEEQKANLGVRRQGSVAVHKCAAPESSRF